MKYGKLASFVGSLHVWTRNTSRQPEHGTLTRQALSAVLAAVAVALIILGASVGAQAGGLEPQPGWYQAFAGPMGKDDSAAANGAVLNDESGNASPQYEMADARRLASAQAEKIVGEDQATWYGPSGYWHRTNGIGWNNHMVWTYVNGSTVCNSICWRSGLPAGNYTVYAYVPRNYATTQNARYNVEYFVGNTWNRMNIVGVNQNNYYDAWVPLGNYNFPGEPAVYLGDDTGESYSGTHRMVGFSAVKFVWTPAAPPPPPPPVVTPPPAPAPTSGIPCFYQGNPSWSAKRLGRSVYTMGNSGCLVTSLAAIACWGGYSTDPGKLCDWLSSHSGFSNNGYLTSQTKINEYTGNKVVWNGSANWRSVMADLNRIKTELDAGRPVVLEVHYRYSDSEAYMHWVVAVGYTLSGSQVSDITIMDPFNSSGKYISLKQKYAYTGSLSRWIYFANFYKRN